MLPHFSRKTKAAIASGEIVLPLPRVAFVRECVAHYEPMLPRPTEEQYTAITKALLKEVPCLKDKGTLRLASFIYDEYHRGNLMLMPVYTCSDVKHQRDYIQSPHGQALFHSVSTMSQFNDPSLNLRATGKKTRH